VAMLKVMPSAAQTELPADDDQEDERDEPARARVPG
jgi:hypothetical protein